MSASSASVTILDSCRDLAEGPNLKIISEYFGVFGENMMAETYAEVVRSKYSFWPFINVITPPFAEGLSHYSHNGECEDYNPQENDWTQLPTELWMNIIYLLPRRSLLQLSCTCSRLHKLCHDPNIWTNVSIDWQTIKKKTFITARLFSRSRVDIKKLYLTMLFLDSLIHYKNI